MQILLAINNLMCYKLCSEGSLCMSRLWFPW